MRERGEPSTSATSGAALPATPTARETLTAVTPAEPVSTTAEPQIECDGKAYSDVESAWAGKRDYCDATVSGEPSVAMLAANELAYGDEADMDSLGTLFSICAQSGKGAWSSDAMATKEQIREVKGALRLCPDHPDQKLITRLLGEGSAEMRLEGEGRIFHSGTYRVGKEIKPGTYAVTGEIEDCYWERKDRTGETIDNHFSVEARRVEVTIRSSDYTFTSQGCGQWRPVG
jgi:hypothetical protein